MVGLVEAPPPSVSFWDFIEADDEGSLFGEAVSVLASLMVPDDAY